MSDLVANTIRSRVYKLVDIDTLEFLKKAGIFNFRIGGSSLIARKGEPINDVDIFPTVSPDEKKVIAAAKANFALVCATKNAITFRHMATGKIVQLCNFHHDSLSNLIRSFDFAHIQVGAEVEIGNKDGFEVITNVKVAYTQNFVDSRMLGDSWYTGRELNAIKGTKHYPLASLIRLFKYHERGLIGKGKLIWAVINIVAEIGERGFADYEDFKDQLDAVDLMIVPGKFEDIQHGTFMRLFEAFTKSPVEFPQEPAPDVLTDVFEFKHVDDDGIEF